MDPRLGDQYGEGIDPSSCEYTLESGLPIKIVGEDPSGTGMQKSGSSMEQWAGVSPPGEGQVAAASEAEASLRRLQTGPTSPTTDRRSRNGHRRNFTPTGLQTQVISERGESDTSDMAASLNLPAVTPLQDSAIPPAQGSSGLAATPDTRTAHAAPQITVTADTEVTSETRKVDVTEVHSISARDDGAIGEYAYSESVLLRQSAISSSGTFSPSGDSGSKHWETRKVDAATTEKIRYTEAHPVATSFGPDHRRSPAVCKPSPVSERRHQTSGLGMGCSRSSSRLLSDTAHAALFGCSIEDNHIAMKHSISMPSNFGKHAGSEPLLPPAQINRKTPKAGGIGIENEKRYKEHLNVLENLHKKATEKEGEAREAYISTTYEFHSAEASFLEAERKLKLQKTRMEGSLKILYTCCENVDTISSALSQWRSKR
ncbi:hypothetical protein PLEOSDRAFT_161540 [Pleurotus ostreatus PC15]|uniref:Uncharacterized protein n=2 Tax=Pleurotus TaxID=5320 RepID=A0A067N9A7_PLEO1|nr:hypothetical protein CCMSSC00406_0002225 [Pleurotus cornucopiae]KDQ24419.1 hypothetical protein PLEOSDRAFT_161540 [Pleurotus ostreatus PC15]